MDDAAPKPSRRERAPTSPDPIEIAMEAQASGEAAQGVALEVLARQSRLIGWQIASERAGVALKLLTGAAGLAAALLLALMVWQAAHATGLVIKPFSAPPELIQRGVTGEAVASQLLDQLNLIGQTARGGEAPQQLAADWGNKISIEIPQTGISIAQVEQWLRERLGHQVQVSGEVMTQPDGSLKLAARMGPQALPVQTGAAADLSAMVVAAAEAIYRREQPFNYIAYLNRQGRFADTLPVAHDVMLQGDPQSRARAWVAYGEAQARLQGAGPALDAFRRAHAIDPWASWLVSSDLAGAEGGLGHVERALALTRQAQQAVRRSRWDSPQARQAAEANLAQRIAAYMGDTKAALDAAEAFAEGKAEGTAARLGERRSVHSRDLALAHQIAAAWAERDEIGFLMQNGAEVLSKEREPWGFPYDIAAAAQDWPRAAEACDRRVQQNEMAPDKGVLGYGGQGGCARAYAMAGRLADAEAVITQTPLDCHSCLIGRATLAEVKGDRAAADNWFGQASRLAPSIPNADYRWAQALLARGETDRALARLAEALRRSPRYADAIELTGEALLSKGDAKAAAARFETAARMVPQWGRLHLKWGEALSKLGQTDAARAHWRTASTLDLLPAERAELARVQGAR